MKDKRRDLLFIIIFILVLYIPSVLYFVLPKGNGENNENRELSKFPAFESLTLFPSSFEEYYNDNLPFRSFLTTSWANINYSFFKTSINEDVVVGKKDSNGIDRWLFYNNKNDNNPLRDITGIKQYSTKELEIIKTSIINNTNKLKKEGIDLYYLLIPNKSTVYTEFLPNNIGIVNESRTEILNQFLIENDINNYLYLKNALVEAKKDYPTYCMTDTHWNDYGSYVGIMELLKLIEKNDKFYCTEECLDVSVKVNRVNKLKEPLTMDLKKLLGISLTTYDYDVTVSFLNDEIIEPEVIEYKNNNILKYRNENALFKKRVMFVGDSFRKETYDFLSKIFSRVIYVHVNDYDKSLISEYKPDIIVLETVERSSQIRLKLEL